MCLISCVVSIQTLVSGQNIKLSASYFAGTYNRKARDNIEAKGHCQAEQFH